VPDNLGKLLIQLGVMLVLLGIVITVFGKIFPFGRMPGDINIKGSGGSFHFPIVSCIVISVILSVLAHIFHR